MPLFLLKRLLQSVVVVLAVALIAFALFRYVGDPVVAMVGQDTSPAERAALAVRLGLDDPFPVQYARFVADAARGEFGVSYRHRRPVAELLAERLPATLELATVSLVLALAVGLPLGVHTALRRDSPLSRLVLAGSLVGVSLPTFVIGLLLILVFGVWLRWLPTFGRGEVVDLGPWSTGLLTRSGLESLVLPATTLALFQATLLIRLVRSEMLEVLRADFIRFARARGLPERNVTLRHALANALVPVITVVGLQFGSVVAFAVVTESVFQWPGIGLLLIQAIQTVDIPVMAATLCLVAALFVAVNLAVDLLHAAIDPRLRVTGDGA